MKKLLTSLAIFLLPLATFADYVGPAYQGDTCPYGNCNNNVILELDHASMYVLLAAFFIIFLVIIYRKVTNKKLYTFLLIFIFGILILIIPAFDTRYIKLYGRKSTGTVIQPCSTGPNC